MPLSDVRVTVPADCTRFVSSIGIDDESGANGSVQFEVYTGATLAFQSAVLTGSSATQSVDVAVSAGQTLRLVAAGGASIDYDHADWADARLLCDATNTPPTARIDLPEADTTWKVGDSFFFAGRGLDTEQGPLPDSALSWSLILHHCAIGGGCHEHPLQSFVGVSTGTFVAPDHAYPSHLELRLTVTDSGGLSDTGSLLLQPETTDLSFESSPPGLQLTVGAGSTATPFTHRAIVGSATSIGAPVQQTLGGVTYEFVSWSDGGTATHQVTAQPTPVTYVATYAPIAVASTRYLSDLPFTLATNGWGPVERDRSNGEQGASDGGQITLNGVTYAKGLGVHALSDVRVTVPADCTRFVSSIGIDDESGANGSVQFEVYTGATLRFQSAVLAGTSATQSVDVAVSAGQTLRLVAAGGASIDYDHADWADARLLCDETEPPPNQPPSLAQPANQSHLVGASPSLQLSATDLDGDALTYSATGLPAGLGVNATSGLISGTIAAGAASGSPYTVTATVADGRGGSAQRTFSWTVSLAPNQPPSLTQPANQSHLVGASPSLQLSATDPDGDALTYSATGLPAGLGVNATSGLISGTIAAGAASGSPYTVTATVADGRGGSAQRTFSWTVSLAPNQPPSLTQPPNQSHLVGASPSLQLSATDPDGDALTYSATGLPPGLGVNATSGLISGTIAAGAASGSPYTVTATVADGRGGSAQRTFSWTVSLPSPPPTPTGFVATATTVDTALAWNAVGGVAGYNIYRAASSTGPYTKLNPTPITGTSYTDTTAPPTTSSWYRVTAVGTGGTESAPASSVAHRRILLVGAGRHQQRDELPADFRPSRAGRRTTSCSRRSRSAARGRSRRRPAGRWCASIPRARRCGRRSTTAS